MFRYTFSAEGDAAPPHHYILENMPCMDTQVEEQSARREKTVTYSINSLAQELAKEADRAVVEAR